MSEKEQRNLSRRQSHAVASLLKKMEDMETQFGASILANIRFPNGSQQSLYTMKVGEGIKFAESSEGCCLFHPSNVTSIRFRVTNIVCL
jgi:hypothetical protein